MEKMKIDGKVCYITGDTNTYEKLLIWPMGAHEKEAMGTVFESLSEELLAHRCLFLACQIEDWNRELSPWEAPAVFGKERFAGRGEETLKWLTQACIPYFQKASWKKGESVPVFVGGYSLAGLFALWSFHETGLLRGAAACSGSLWYPGFMEYVRDKEAVGNKEVVSIAGAIKKEEAADVDDRKKHYIYLSLGTKEGKTRNPVMAAVQGCTEELYDFYRSKPEIMATLEFNPGNHFTEPEKRLLKGFRWLIENGAE